MKYKKITCSIRTLSCAIPLLGFSVLFAQDSEVDDDVFELSPFVVESGEDEGYQATATLAGTRVRTDLKDLASPISVITSQFLEDTGATSNQELLVYTTNTEVGGLFGNFAGVGNTQGIGEGANLSRPSSNTRVRGLDAADNTRNYFLSDIPWDSFNVDRLDLQRGPNSILFGVGSPAGIINHTTIVPTFENGGKLETRVDGEGSFRASLDYNRVLVDDQLAVRAALLKEHTKYQQKPAFEKDKRGFVAATFQPEMFKSGNTTRISVSFEKGEIEANRPRILPPVDNITPWWTSMNKTLWDPFWSWEFGAQIDRGNSTRANNNPFLNNPWLSEAMPNMGGGRPKFIYDNSSSAPVSIRQGQSSTAWALNADGMMDATIDGFTFARPQHIAGFNEYSKNASADAIARGLPDPFPGAAKNFYKDIHLSDPGVFDFYNRLIDGDNKREWSEWTAFNISLSQTFMSNRVGFELIYDYQDYKQGGWNLLGRPFIGIDINSHLSVLPTEYPTAIPDEVVPAKEDVQGGILNPYAARAYVSGGNGGGSSQETVRENLRLTTFAEVKGSDFFEDDSFLAKLIGRNVLTGVLSRDERRTFDKNWKAFSTSLDYAYEVNNGGAVIDGGIRDMGWAVYLSDDLSNTANPGSLNLPEIQSLINPSGEYVMTVFDSHWNAPDVDPASFFRLPVNGVDSTQSENPDNYVGLSEYQLHVLNATTGDLRDLMTGAAKKDEVLDSYGLTWQGFWWDGVVVPTFGWRHDEIETWGRSGGMDPVTNVRSTDFRNSKSDAQPLRSEGETVTWGVVAHSESLIEDRLPGNLNFSVFYNESENFRAINRYGFSGKELPNPTGNSEDFGVVVNAFDNKLSFKVTLYETEVKDASFSGSSPLGNNVWFLHNVESWGTALALRTLMYWEGDLDPGQWGPLNHAAHDAEMEADPSWTEYPYADEAYNHPSAVRSREAAWDWFQTLPPQSFFDAYGIPIDTGKTGSYEQLQTLIDNGNWDPNNGIWTVRAAGEGRINGISPTISIDNLSKGVEFEIQVRPIENWKITINASKTEATRANLGSEIVEWIEFQHNRLEGPAGDLRLWWGDDQTIRKYYNDFVYQSYKFQEDANGQSAPEIRPWRFNIVNDYSFSEGALEGLNVGGAFRWQDDAILGYRLNDDKTKLDPTRPIHGGAESNLDLWVGYARNLGDNLHWRIQLNARNIGQDNRLIPVSVNPDGTVAAGRIAEGMSWQLSNTFSF